MDYIAKFVAAIVSRPKNITIYTDIQLLAEAKILFKTKINCYLFSQVFFLFFCLNNQNFNLPDVTYNIFCM